MRTLVHIMLFALATVIGLFIYGFVCDAVYHLRPGLIQAIGMIVIPVLAWIFTDPKRYGKRRNDK